MKNRMTTLFLMLVALPVFGGTPQSAPTTNQDCTYRQAKGTFPVSPNGDMQGFRSTMTIARLGAGTQKAAWFSVLFQDGWFQMGYHFRASYPEFFYMYFRTPGTQGVFNVEAIAERPKFKVGDIVTFEMIYTENNIWYLSANNQRIFKLTYNLTKGLQAAVAIEQTYSCSTEKFATVRFYPAMEYFVNGKWEEPSKSFGFSRYFGLQGRIQNSALNFNEIRMGSEFQPSPNSGLDLF